MPKPNNAPQGRKSLMDNRVVSILMALACGLATWLVVTIYIDPQGSTTIRHRRGDIDVTATWCVDPATAVKHVRIHTINRGHRTLQLRIIGMAEWLMGANRSDRSSVHVGVFQSYLLAEKD